MPDDSVMGQIDALRDKLDSTMKKIQTETVAKNEFDETIDSI